MTLTPGTRFGPYEITGPLGAGGMGEVYRARDTRLNRDVAIKVLPELFASDPERLARFEREAQTLASLNHPHIAQIHGVEDSGGGRALVMELVEGETLAERIARGAAPIDEATPIALQIAEALEAAHERGIIHRDLKPANIKVRPDGDVKVLDFGLAKLSETAAAASTGAATMTSPATQLGVVLGTAAYMAPEQARGKIVDKRADIWAFGCVLYELLTGRRPFDGDTVTDVMAAIVTREPDWNALPPATPPHVRHLLRRCLEKDARTRLRDIGEARLLLSSSPPPADAPQAPRRRPWMYGAIAGAAIAGVAGGYFAAGARRDAVQPALVTSFVQVSDQPGLEHQPTISPDGKTIVYVSAARGNQDLYLLRIGGRKALLLTEDSSADDYAPAFSPDGARIAFRSERAGGGVFVMEATGESVRRVSDAGFDPRWSPDGTELLVADERVADPMSRAMVSSLWAMNLQTGQRRLVAKGDAVGGRWSPSGRRVVYWGIKTAPFRDLAVVAADGSDSASPRWITDDAAVDWSPVWSPDGRHIYFGSSRGGTMNLWRVPIDESTGATTGPPEPVTTPAAWSGGFDFAADGRSLVFADLDERTTLWSAAFDPQRGALASAPTQVLQGRAINSIDVSPDGRTIVFSQRGQPWEALGIVRIDGSGWSRLTDDSAFHRLPTWSPDGTRLLFYMSRGGRMWTLRPDGSALTEIVLPAGQSIAYPVWSPDGRRVVASASQPAAGVVETTTIYDVTVSPARVVDRFEPGRGLSTDIRPFSWSPDGRRIAGAIRTGHRDEVMVLDLQSRQYRSVAQRASSPAWLPDSRRLMLHRGGQLVVLDVDSGEERALLPNARVFDSWGRVVSLSRDGRTFAYLQFHGEGDVWLMKIGGGAK